MMNATYGYTLQRLLKVSAPPGPTDFAAFWQETYRETAEIALRPNRKKVPSVLPGIDVYEISYTSLNDVRIGGWLTVPSDGSFNRGVVVGHGYGGRDVPDAMVPGRPAAVIFPCARGFNRSANAQIPGVANDHVLHGIGCRESYSLRGCVADLWCAVTALLEWFPWLEGAVHYCGSSFGGGIGALALPWDARIHRSYLDVPTFGNHPLRLTLNCEGSGEAVRQYYQQHPEVLETLMYFDAATAAHYIQTPVFVAAALSDPSVPPPGQFSVYNALSNEKKLFVMQTGHPVSEADVPVLMMELDVWFDR